MSRTPQDRLADIRDSAVRAQRAVEALQRAAAARNDDEEQMAFDALLYRGVDPQIIRRTVDAPLRDLQVAAGRLMDDPNADRG